jgi:hypothetical protein
MEVGIALMERIEIGEVMLESQKKQTEAAIMQVGIMEVVIKEQDEEIRKSKNRGRLAHIATAAVVVFGVIVAL